MLSRSVKHVVDNFLNLYCCLRLHCSFFQTPLHSNSEKRRTDGHDGTVTLFFLTAYRALKRVRAWYTFSLTITSVTSPFCSLSQVSTIYKALINHFLHVKVAVVTNVTCLLI